MLARSRETVRLVARAVAAVAAVYCGALVVLLGANVLQVGRVDLLESPALDRLVERLSASPEDRELRDQVRSFDLVARRAYFDSRDRLRAGSILLFGGLVALVASLRVLGWLDARLERPDAPSGVTARRNTARRARLAIAGAGVTLGLATIALSEGLAARDAAGAASKTERPEVTLLTGPEDWPAFRGPGGAGVAGGMAAPTSWDVPAGRGVLWQVPVPLPGFSSPVVWKGAVYLSGSDGTSREVYSWDGATGALRFRFDARGVPGSPESIPEVTEDTGHAAPSMATDGERVFALFSNGDLVALDAEGALVWSRALGIAEAVYGYASSLLATSSYLYVQYDESGGGRLYALETASGNTAWVVERQAEAAWSSPILAITPAGARLVLNGNPAVSCYDAATGDVLWSVDCMMGDVAPSPAYADGVVYAAASIAPLSAFRIDDGSILWQSSDLVPDVSSPVAAEGLLFSATSYGSVSCRDAATGELRWSHDFDEGFYASPVVAGGMVYLTDRRGRTVVFAAAAAYREASVSPLGEPSDCTPAFSGGRVYLRGKSSLVCVGGDG